MFRFWHCKWEVRHVNFSLQRDDKVSLFAKYLSQVSSWEVESIILIPAQEAG